MSWIIKVEDISKIYRLGTVGASTLQDDLKRLWYNFRGKEDPFLKIGESNLRDSAGGDYIWALKDINFEVTQGEVLGIIGKNGAGKSTLLKLLSKVTKPTTGSIKTRGRIASLLEVGTGFHPELTGRENIFLNGAILGMKKHEIKAKFDEIVAFSGCERYIDTPVKRYSSGMYVRLAFAVAAHLEPEILVVDEVLAVGDAEFQKKCLGKMKDVAGQGRTVLFVSHNMTAVKSLCNNAILLRNGQLINSGKVDYIVDEYLKINSEDILPRIEFEHPENAPGNEHIKIKKVITSPEKIFIDQDIEINFEFWNLTSEEKLLIGYDLINIHEQVVFSTGSEVRPNGNKIGTTKCIIPANLLNDSTYKVCLYFSTEGMKPLYQFKEIISFEVHDKEREYAYYGKINGVVRPKLNWVQE